MKNLIADAAAFGGGKIDVIAGNAALRHLGQHSARGDE